MEGNSKIDNVNHPKHYQSSSGLETIEVIESFTENLKGAEATNTGNVLKYMCRWKEKNGLEDLKKAEWYLKRLIKFVEKAKRRTRMEKIAQWMEATMETSSGVVKARKCSLCGEKHVGELKYGSRYCPDCGAIMENSEDWNKESKEEMK